MTASWAPVGVVGVMLMGAVLTAAVARNGYEAGLNEGQRQLIAYMDNHPQPQQMQLPSQWTEGFPQSPDRSWNWPVLPSHTAPAHANDGSCDLIVYSSTPDEHLSPPVCAEILRALHGAEHQSNDQQLGDQPQEGAQ